MKPWTGEKPAVNGRKGRGGKKGLEPYRVTAAHNKGWDPVETLGGEGVTRGKKTRPTSSKKNLPKMEKAGDKNVDLPKGQEKKTKGVEKRG